MRVIALIEDPVVVRAILTHLGRWQPKAVLFHYTAERAVLKDMAESTFAALRSGTIRIELRHRYPLAAAADVHRELEARRTMGPIVLLP